MKKAKVVVNQASKQNRFLRNKTAALLALGTIATLGVVSVVVPTSNIPGFNYIAQAIGLNADATRNLTMLDFASYAIGTKDNKIDELRAMNLSYNGQGNYGSGLSPFATLTSDRLAEAYAQNAQEAVEMEKSLGGKINSFDKNSVDGEFVLDPNLIGKGFDPTKLSGNAKAAYSGAMEALAAAAGQQAEAFGRPVKKEDLQNVANLVGLKDPNISNIVGSGNILSIARKDDLLYSRMSKDAKALMGTSIFGSVNPEFSRTDTRIGRPVYGLFKDLGTAFFFSRYAAGAKLPTAASDIAVAAFDGGSPQSESIITQEETEEDPSVTVDPEQELSQGAHNVNMCAQVVEGNRDLIAAISEAIKAFIEAMRTITLQEQVNANHTKIPGCCIPIIGANNKTLRARHKWNYYLNRSGVQEHMGGIPEIDKSLYEMCQELIETRNMLAGNCGITFEEPEYTCEQMAEKLHLGSCQRQVPERCPNISIFGTSDSSVNISKNKLEEYQRLYREYTTRAEDPLSPEEAMQQAAIDVGILEPDINGDVLTMCQGEVPCLEHINDVLSKTFAVKDIIDIRGLIMQEYGDKDPKQLRNYDAQQLEFCINSGNMESCQDIVDYYNEDMWKEQCSAINKDLYHFIDPNTGNLRPNWPISKIRSEYGPLAADCIVIYLSIH